MLPKTGKLLRLSRIKWRFIWNYPWSLALYPVIGKIFPYTMVSYSALYQIYTCVKILGREKVVGSLVETGCWNGGAGAFMAWSAKQYPIERHTWLFDSFRGLPPLTDDDSGWALRVAHPKEDIAGSYVASQALVQEALAKLDVTSTVSVITGWFQDTIPTVKKKIGQIALLRLDGDTYDSTKYCLEELYDQVVPGGYVIVDDYHLEGCRKALYDFFHARALSPIIQSGILGERAYIRK